SDLSGLIAASLIWVSSLSDGDSGMEGLQALALLSALPFSVVMIGMTISLWRSLGDEVKVIEKLELRLRQGEFIQRYSAELTDEVSGRVEDRVAEQVEAQVSEHLSTYTAEMPADPVQPQRVRDQRAATCSRSVPSTRASRFSPIRSSAPTGRPPAACGVISSLGASQRGSSCGSGSGSVTSIAALPSVPASSASRSATWSTVAPRPTLSRIAWSGSAASTSRPTAPAVASVAGRMSIS